MSIWSKQNWNCHLQILSSIIRAILARWLSFCPSLSELQGGLNESLLGRGQNTTRAISRNLPFTLLPLQYEQLLGSLNALPEPPACFHHRGSGWRCSRNCTETTYNFDLFDHESHRKLHRWEYCIVCFEDFVGACGGREVLGHAGPVLARLRTVIWKTWVIYKTPSFV